MLFQKSVVEGLPRRAIEAIENNEDIKDVGIRRKVQLDILGGTVAYLQVVFGDDTPSEFKGRKCPPKINQHFQSRSTQSR